MQLTARCRVGVELPLAEPMEDGRELFVDERVAACGVEVQGARNSGHADAALVDSFVEVAVRAIEIREYLEALERDVEVVEAVPLGDVEQRRCELDQARPDAWVARGAGDRCRLRSTDRARVQSLDEAGHAIGGPRQAQLGGDFGARPVARRPQISLHAPMAVGALNLLALGGGDRQRHLRVDPPPQQFERAKSRVDVRFGCIDELFDDQVDGPFVANDLLPHVPVQRADVHGFHHDQGVCHSCPADRHRALG